MAVRRLQLAGQNFYGGYMLKQYWLIVFGFVIVLGWRLTMPPTHLYKVISVENWEKSKLQDRLILPPMDDDFIHLSMEHQVDNVIAKFWKNTSEFFVLTIKSSQLPGKLVFESNPGGSNKYYHLYDGFIPMSAVTLASKTTV